MGDSVVDAAGNTWVSGYLDATANFSDTINAAKNGNLSQIQGGGCRLSNHGNLWAQVEAQGASLRNASLEKIAGISAGAAPATRWTGVVRKAYPEGGAIAIEGESVRGARHRELPQTVVNGDAFPHARDQDLGRPIPLVLGKVPKVPCRAIEQKRRGRNWWDLQEGRADTGAFAISIYPNLADGATTQAREAAIVHGRIDKLMSYLTGDLAVTDAKLVDTSGRVVAAGDLCTDAATNYPTPDAAPDDLYLEIVNGDGAGQVLKVATITPVLAGVNRCEIIVTSRARTMPEPGDAVRLFRQRVRLAAHDRQHTYAFNHADGTALNDRLYLLRDGTYYPIPNTKVRAGEVAVGGSAYGGYSVDSDLFKASTYSGRFYVPPQAISPASGFWLDEPHPAVYSGSPANIIDGDLGTAYEWDAELSTYTMRFRITVPRPIDIGIPSFERALFVYKLELWSELSRGWDGAFQLWLRGLDFAGATIHEWFADDRRYDAYRVDANAFPAGTPILGAPTNDDGYFANTGWGAWELTGLTAEEWERLGAIEFILTVPSAKVDQTGVVPRQRGKFYGVGICLEVDTDLAQDTYATDLIARTFDASGWADRLASQPAPEVGGYIKYAPHQIEDILIEELGLPSRATSDASGQVDAGSVESCVIDLLNNLGVESADALTSGVCVTERTGSEAVIGWYCKDWGIVEVQDAQGREALRALYRGARSETYEYTLSDSGAMSDRYIEGSLTRLGQTAIEDVVNCPTFRFAYDPTKQEYTQSCGFSHLDAAGFPDADADWKAYASGFGDDYLFARRAWEILRDSVRRTGRVVTATIDCRTIYDVGLLRRLLLPSYGMGHLEWLSSQKDVFRCRVPEDHALCGATLWSRVRCRNALRTGGAWRYGWLAERKSLDESAAYEVAVVLEPAQVATSAGILFHAFDDDPSRRIAMAFDDNPANRITESFL